MADWAAPISPDVEPVLMMTPDPALRISGNTAWAMNADPLTFTANVRSQRSGVTSASGSSERIPALL